MFISSRTPEGYPSQCPLCRGETNLEFSEPLGDAPCPQCGHLLLRSAMLLAKMQKIVGDRCGVNPNRVTVDTRLSQHIIAEQLGVDVNQVTDSTQFVNDLGADSLDTVELVMELEEEFDINIDDEAAERIRTVGDVIRHLNERHRQQGPE